MDASLPGTTAYTSWLAIAGRAYAVEVDVEVEVWKAGTLNRKRILTKGSYTIATSRKKLFAVQKPPEKSMSYQ